MPMTNDDARTRGLPSQVTEQTVFESGTPIQKSASSSGAGSSYGEITTPGSLTIGNQVQVIPASTALADALMGLSQGMQAAGQGWDRGLRYAAEQDINKLKREYLDHKNSGMDDVGLSHWLRSTGFKANEY